MAADGHQLRPWRKEPPLPLITSTDAAIIPAEYAQAPADAVLIEWCPVPWLFRNAQLQNLRDGYARQILGVRLDLALPGVAILTVSLLRFRCGVQACSGMAPQVRIAWRELHRLGRIGNPNA